MLTRELLRISCAAPGKHKHHDGQWTMRKTTWTDEIWVAAKEGKVWDRERKQEGMREWDGRTAGWRVLVLEREQGRMGSTEVWKDGQKRQQQKRGGGEGRMGK